MATKYTLAEHGPRLEQFLNRLFELAGFSLSFKMSEGETIHPDFENPDIMVRFSGDDADILLGNKAETLLALEQLSSEALGMSSEEHARLCFDVNDHRIMRIHELRATAEAAAEQVKKTRRPFHFSPMNSRERRIIHLALRGETDVRSESVGEGPIRQCVIVPAEMTTLPEPIRPPRPRPEEPGRPGDRRGGGGFRGRGDRGGDRGGPRGGGGRDRRGPRR